MSLFQRHQLAEPDQEHRRAAIGLTDAFQQHDVTALADLTPDERAAQLHARLVLYEYINAIWQAPDTVGLHPGADPWFAAVAGIRDLAAVLVTDADEAQAKAGDQT